ncbi:MAG: sugar ABC transporter substrate-binding protein [Lachnospiraceae bacterium]|nr:sugar ABC transporter substrate-binding protein [Lachnospiraceae bacterium]
MKKQVTAIMMAGAVAFSMSGPVLAEEDFLVGFANNSDTYDYCATFRKYLKEETEALGMSIVVTDAGGDTNVQNGQIDDFIVQGADVVSAISNDLDGSVPALEAAIAADLPYVTFLTSVTGGDDYEKYIYIGSENYDAGVVQGEYLLETLPENAQILYFTGTPNDQQYIDRKAGLEDTLAERDDIEILAEYNVENQKDLGMSTAEDCMQAFESFDAIVCQNDDAALGVIEALKSADRLDGVIVIGIDGSDAALESVQAGEMSMTVLQNARAQAQAGAEVFASIRDGEDPADIEDVKVPFEEVTIDNVADYLSDDAEAETE